MNVTKKRYDAPDVAVVYLETQGVFALSSLNAGPMSIEDWTEEDVDSSLIF